MYNEINYVSSRHPSWNYADAPMIWNNADASLIWAVDTEAEKQHDQQILF